MRNKERIGYYTLYGYSAEKDVLRFYDLVDMFGKSSKNYNINDYIESYLATEVFNQITTSTNPRKMEAEHLRDKVSNILTQVSRYFKGLPLDSIKELYQKVIPNYREVFWKLFDRYQLANSLMIDIFPKALFEDENTLRHILRNKNLVKTYGEMLSVALTKCATTAEWLVDNAELDPMNERARLYFPHSLKSADIEGIFLRYVEREDAKYGYLCRIARGFKNQMISLSSRTRYKAKIRSEEIAKGLFSSGKGVEFGASIIFDENMKGEFEIDEYKPIFRARYSYQWIVENMDNPTLLNNFIYLFDYMSWFDMRCLLVSNNTMLDVFESITLNQSRNEYPNGTIFEFLNLTAEAQMIGYYNTLKKLDVRLEALLEWFFQEYLVDEFDIEGFYVALPSKDTTMLEKCTLIMPALEHVLKQFSFYCEERNINQEFLTFQSEQLAYDRVPSLQNKKYIYASSVDCLRIQGILFSQPITLKNSGKEYENLYECIESEDFSLDDASFNFQKRDIEWLIEKAVLTQDKHGNIRGQSKDEIYVHYMLHNKEVLVYPHLQQNLKECIDQMLAEGMLCVENTLFSRQEAAYYDFHLNKRIYLNGLDLRNKYQHSQPKQGVYGKHKTDYMIFLKLFVIAVIKINDDICCVAE